MISTRMWKAHPNTEHDDELDAEHDDEPDTDEEDTHGS